MRWLKKTTVTPLSRLAKVIDNLLEQQNDRFNAPSIHAVREYVSENMLTIYPVGSIYLSVNPDDPGLVFGGTWERIKDRFLLAAGDTYTAGNLGGAATHNHYASASVAGHVLTTNEIPAHKHGIAGGAVAPTGSDGIPIGWTEQGATVTGGNDVSKITSATGVLDLELEMQNTGGGQAHTHSATVAVGTQSSMPPYLVVYVWKRVA